MQSKLTFVSLGLFGLLTSACAIESDESTTQQDIKGKNKLFATQRGLKQVSVFDQDGALQGTMKGTGLGVAFGDHVEGDDVYVVSQDTGSVFAHIHAEGENGKERWELTQLVPPGSGLVAPFYPNVKDGTLYVSSQNSNTYGEVFKFDALTGSPLGAIAAAGTGGLNGPRGIDWDSAGNLYVAGFRSNNVVRFGADGSVSTFASFPSGTGPCGVSINSADQICVASAGGTAAGASGVHCFSGDGTQIYGNPATFGQVPICGIDWGRDGLLYATRPPLGTVETHNIATGEVAPFVSVALVAGISWGTHNND